MKALIIVDSDSIFDLLLFYLKPLGFDLIRYRNPLKAIDNLEEISPEAVIMSAKDYPRHWKPLIQLIRCKSGKEKCVFILLKGDLFPFEEAAKAAYLGVNGVVRENLDDRAEVTRLQQLLKRYVEIDDARSNDRLVPSAIDRFYFAFNHPSSSAIVSGKIETISATGISFKPDIQHVASDLDVGVVVEDCSLRAGQSIIGCSAELVRKGNTLAFRFLVMEDTDKKGFEDYLRASPERRIRALLKKK
ncbi:MAG: PilZ domain-containing protein [Spirochaetes bacterium]|nr:PilZ domain-containing protein [Spirochaetota bacterium]